MNETEGAGEVAQWLRALAALVENWGLVSYIYMVAHKYWQL